MDLKECFMMMKKACRYICVCDCFSIRILYLGFKKSCLPQLLKYSFTRKSLKSSHVTQKNPITFFHQNQRMRLWNWQHFRVHRRESALVFHHIHPPAMSSKKCKHLIWVPQTAAVIRGKDPLLEKKIGSFPKKNP